MNQGGCTFSGYVVPSDYVDGYAASGICSGYGLQLAQLRNTQSTLIASMYSFCGFTDDIYIGNLDGYSASCNKVNSLFNVYFWLEPNFCLNSYFILCGTSTTVNFIPASTDYTGLSYTLPVATSVKTTTQTSTFTGPLTVSISGEPVITIPISLATIYTTTLLTSTSILGNAVASTTVPITTTVSSFLSTTTTTILTTTLSSQTLSPTVVYVVRSTEVFFTVTDTLTIGTSSSALNTNTQFTTITFTSTECGPLVTLTVGVNTTITTTTTTTTIVPIYEE